jgi:glycosyltransferase involved in cell wall biosynthesis
MKKVIGVKAINYPEKRNFIELPLSDYVFSKKIDFYKFPAYIYFILNKKTHPYWLNLFYDINLGNYYLLHFFNAVNLGNKPWITTFEYYLPRGAHNFGQYPKENKYIDKVIGRLAHPSCKKLIAISKFAYDSQAKYLQRYGKYESIIMDKTIIIHPPQILNLNNVKEKESSSKLHLSLVGSDFFRKGGLESLIAIDELLSNGAQLEFNIVSSLQYGDYASKSTIDDYNNAINIINKHDAIKLHNYLPNKQVIELLKKTNIALLPSYEETYGYTVLEAQSCGCPVITTNGTAFTEINNNDCGWIIKVPLDSENRSVPRNIKDLETFKSTIITEVKNIIIDVLANPEILQLKGQNSIQRIMANHNIENASIKLKTLYDNIQNK